MKFIPVSKENNYIKYNNNALIIKIDRKGNSVKIQCDGVSCMQKNVKGYLFKSFKTKNKWFNPNWWYKKTCWSNAPGKLHFNKPDLIKKFKFKLEDLFLNKEEEYKLNTEATKLSIHVDNILKSIKKEVEKNIKLNINFDFENSEYGVNWCEAYIPIKIGKEKYLLTWENCD